MRTGIGNPPLLHVAGIAALAFAGAYGCIEFIPRVGGVEALWPTNGLILVLMLRYPPAQWPALLIATVLGSIIAVIPAGVPVVISLGVAACNIVGMGIAACLLRRWTPDMRSILSNPRSLIAFSIIGGMLGPALSVIICGSFRVLMGAQPNGEVWCVWLLAKVLGTLTVAPLLLSLNVADARLLLQKNQAISAACVLICVISTSLVVFGQNLYPLMFLIFPVMILAALQFGFLGAAGSTLLIAIIAIRMTLTGHGPLALITGQATIFNLLLLQGFLAACALTSLPVAAVLRVKRSVKQALESREARLRILVDHSTDLIIGLEGTGILRYASPAVQRLFGYSMDELIGRSLLSITHPADRDWMIQKAGEAEGRTYTFRVIRKDGSTAWTESTFRRNNDGPSNNRIDIIGVVRDITGRVEAENALRRSEDLFRKAMEYSPIGMALVSPSGKWLQVNEALCQIVGYDRDELHQMTFQDITYADDLDADLGHVAALLRGEVQNYQMEKRYIRKDGSRVWVLLAVSVVRNEHDKPEYFISQINDITARKDAEAALTATTERLTEANRVLLYAEEMAHIGHIRLDMGLEQIHWSEGAYRIYGVSPTESVTFESAMAICHPNDLEKIRGVTRRCFESGEPYLLEHRIVRPDGAIRDVMVRGRAAPAGNGTLIAAIQDITELRDAERDREARYCELQDSYGRMEEQGAHLAAMTEQLALARDAAEAASRAKSVFLANMSHEIRTPMNAVLGFADLLLDGQLAPEQRRKMNLLRDAGRSLLSIIDDILDVSKVEAGKLKLERIAMNLREVVEGALAIVQTQADGKHLSMATSFAPDLPEWVSGDPTRLRQILLNLLSNAIKFTEQGGIHIAIQRESASD